MNRKNIIFGFLVVVICAFGFTGVLHAESNGTNTATSTKTVKLSAKETLAMRKSKEKATEEIVRRVKALNDLSVRIGEMKNISESDKTGLISQLQGQATSLNNLQLQINNDESTTTLRESVKSITESYRVFALVIPQGRIYATVDRIATLIADLATIGSKLESRIKEKQDSGKDVSDLMKILNDYNTKLIDVQNQNQTAFSQVNGLVSDQGDQEIMKSNTATLKDARAKIKIAIKDLADIRKYITKIKKGLPKKIVDLGNASTTSATSTTLVR